LLTTDLSRAGDGALGGAGPVPQAAVTAWRGDSHSCTAVSPTRGTGLCGHSWLRSACGARGEEQTQRVGLFC